MKPTDEQLNEAARKLTGWTFHPELIERWCSPSLHFHVDPPNYCKDRNALPELWAAVTKAGEQQEFGGVLDSLAGRDGYLTEHANADKPFLGDTWYLATAAPRLHVIAALKVCGQWPDDWEAD